MKLPYDPVEKSTIIEQSLRFVGHRMLDLKSGRCLVAPHDSRRILKTLDTCLHKVVALGRYRVVIKIMGLTQITRFRSYHGYHAQEPSQWQCQSKLA
jgi:hypothetical protein